MITGSPTRMVLLFVLSCICACSTSTIHIEDKSPFGTDDTETETETSLPDGFQLKPLEATLLGYRGVDILLVVDNSTRMESAQTRLAEEVHDLLRRLTEVMEPDSVESIRVGITTSEAPLRWNQVELKGCTNTYTAAELISSPCQKSPTACLSPCDTESGHCIVLDGANTPCRLPPDAQWLDSSLNDPNPDIAVQAACLAIQGSGGCVVEQPLLAGIRVLENHEEFLTEDHLLVVVVISDEEDCSVENPQLYVQDEWLSETNIDDGFACLYPSEAYLYSTNDISRRLLALKGNRPEALVFAAIVGVPADSTCSGSPVDVTGCLGLPEMERHPIDGEFDLACGSESQSATPGRRYVELASMLGTNGFVYSICDPDWGPVSDYLFHTIRRGMGQKKCYGLDASLETLDAPSGSFPDFQRSVCRLYTEVETNECPPELLDSWEADFTNYYENVFHSRSEKGLLCPIPQRDFSRQWSCWIEPGYDEPIWYYCSNDLSQENTELLCSDGLDNDMDDYIDCSDQDCLMCTSCYGGGCGQARCADYEIVLTEKAKEVVSDRPLFISCPPYWDLGLTP